MPTLHDHYHVTVSSDDQESFETDTVLITIQARIAKASVPDGLNEALRDIGQRIVDSTNSRRSPHDG